MAGAGDRAGDGVGRKKTPDVEEAISPTELTVPKTGGACRWR